MAPAPTFRMPSIPRSLTARLALLALLPLASLPAGEAQLTNDYISGLDIFGTGNGVNFVDNGKISGGTSHAADQSTYFMLSTANAITGGTQTMMGLSSFLRTNAANSLVGGTQNFTGQNSTLLAYAANGITGGTQNFSGTSSSLRANAAQAVNGGSQHFTGSQSLLIASAAGSITGGHQHIHNGAKFEAQNPGTVTGGTAHLYSGGLYDIWETNATTSGASVIFEDGGSIDLDASTTLGRISSTNNGAGNLNSWTGATLTVHFDSSNATFSGTATNSLDLVKAGSGNWTLTGKNTHTGGTAVTGGTLTLATGGQIGAIRGGLIINSGGTVVTSVNNALGSGTGTKVNAIGLNGGTLNHTGTGGHGLGIAYDLNNGATLTSNGGVSSTTADSHLSIDTASSVTAFGAAPSTIAGRVDLRGDGGLGNVNFTVHHGARLNLTAGISSHSSANVEGPVGIIKNDLGTLALTGNNTYTGNTTVNGGLVEFNSATALGATSNKVILNGGGLSWAPGTTTDISGRLNALGASGGTFDTNGNNVAFATALSGAGALTKTGAGTLTLSSVNTHTGGTIVNEGILRLTTGGQFGAIRGHLTINEGATVVNTVANAVGWGTGTKVTDITINGGTFHNTAANGAGTAIAFTLNGGTMISNDGVSSTTSDSRFVADSFSSFQVGGAATSTISGRMDLRTDGGTPNVNFTVDADATLHVSAGISSHTFNTVPGPVGFTKLGTGTMVLTGDNTYTGTTVVSAGTLQAGHANALGSGGTISFGGGTLRYGSGITTDFSSRFSTDASQQYAVDTNGNAVTFATGLASSGGSLTKSGAGTLTLTGANTYSGATTISAGTLQIGNGGTTGSVAGNIVNNAALTFNRSNTATYAGVISGTGSLTTSGTGLLMLTGANTYTGATTVSSGSSLSLESTGSLSASSGVTIAANAALAANDTSVGALPGIITNHGTFNLYNSASAGSSTLTNDGSVHFRNTASAGSGSISNNGSLFFANASSAGSATVTNGSNATLDLSDHLGGLAIGSLAGSGTVKLGANALTVGGLNTSTTISAVIADGGLYGGMGGALTKTGTGTLTLTGANTYTGATNVSAGTLVVNGSSAASAFTVADGATLGGSGTVGSLTIAGTLAPGNSPGTLNAGNTTFAGGGTFEFEINDANGSAGTSYDLLAISGTLTIDATSGSPFGIDVTSLTLANTAGLTANFDSAADYSFTFITTTGGITGFSADKFAVSTTNFTNPFSGTWSVAQSGNNLTLNYTGVSAIPEPSTYAAIFGAGALAVAVWRRRRRA